MTGYSIIICHTVLNNFPLICWALYWHTVKSYCHLMAKPRITFRGKHHQQTTGSSNWRCVCVHAHVCL